MRLVSFLYANLTIRNYFCSLKTLILHLLSRQNVLAALNNKFSSYIGASADNLYFLGSGRSGLYSILRAMDIGHGDEVIVQAFTCVVVPNAICYCGATPVYVDINLHTLNAKACHVEQKITAKTKAIIVQHTFGRPAEIQEIVELAKKYNLFLIEDCAAALDSKINGVNVGLYGDASFFSMEMSKTLNCGWGGAVLINSPSLSKKFHSYFQNVKFGNPLAEIRENLQILLSIIFYSPNLYRFSRKLIALLVKLGVFTQSINSHERRAEAPPQYIKKLGLFKRCLILTQLGFIEESREKRMWFSKIYRNALESYGYKAEEDNPYLRFSIFVKDRDRVLSIAKLKGLDLGSWFSSPLHPINDEKVLNKLGYRLADCPNAEFAASHIINFPTHSKLNYKDLNMMLELVTELPENDFYSKEAVLRTSKN